MLTRDSTELTDPPGGPITGGQVVPSHWRNKHQSGPMPLAGDSRSISGSSRSSFLDTSRLRTFPEWCRVGASCSCSNW